MLAPREVTPHGYRYGFRAHAVSDVPRAHRFYQEVVGLLPGESFGDQFVDDIAAARAGLVERGVPIREVHESPVCYFAFATDPDGNGFGIHQRKSVEAADTP